MNKKESADGGKPRREPGLLISLVPIVTVFVLLLLSLMVFHLDIHIPLIFAAIVAATISVLVLHNRWEDVEKGIITSIMNAMQAILIACIIGLIIAAWIGGGIVPSLIYYGLKILSPQFFLVTCLLVCSVLSIATGSSWTTAGTMGVAMVGIGSGMGIPPAITAGCVVSGAYFGDKMSPFSDTTNLAPAVAGTTLFAHIRHMIYTTGISYVLALIGFAVINFKYTSSGQLDSTVEEVMGALRNSFEISPLLVLPVIILVLMIVFKVPAIPGLIVSVLIGIVCAVTVQGMGVGELGTVLQYGFEAQTQNAMLDELLSSGGLQNMMWTVSLILCSLTFGGIMFQSGMLDAIGRSILRVARGTGGLICATGLTAIVVNLICGEQYLSILLTGKMYREEYERRDLAPQNLSRTLEDFGTITSPLVPWTTCAVAMSTYMGVATVDYLPWALMNLINPIVAIIIGFTGWTIKKRSEVDPADLVE